MKLQRFSYVNLKKLVIVILSIGSLTSFMLAFTNNCSDSSCPIIQSKKCCCSSSKNKTKKPRDCKDDVICKSHFTPRSQGLDTARWLVGKNSIVRFYETDQIYGDFSMTAEFSRSFRRERIGKYFTPSFSDTSKSIDSCLSTDSCKEPSVPCSSCKLLYCSCPTNNNSTNNAFTSFTSDQCGSSSCSCKTNQSSCNSQCQQWACNCNCFTMGSDKSKLAIDEKQTVQVRSEDFGFNSTAQICMCPRVSNVIIDFNLYAGLTDYIKGLFVEIHAPVVHSWWENEVSICYDETCCIDRSEDEDGKVCATDTFSDCLMSQNNTNNSVGTTNPAQALDGNFKWGDVKNKLLFGRIASGRISKTRLADFRMAVGYDVFLSKKFRIAPKIVIAAPTGNVPTAYYMFEPIVGNSGHWELGGGLSAYAIGYETDTNQIGVFLEGYVAHMFTSRCQRRTFDLKNNGCFSRYLLLKRFRNDGTILDGLERGPNVLSQTIKTQIDVQGDVSAMLSWKHNSWNIDLGYNFWGRTREKIKEFCCCIPEKRYGIKGIAPVCETGESKCDETTASLSTIAESLGNDGMYDTDCEPIYLTCNDLDLCSALHPSALSHAVFFHFTNTWHNEGDTLQPFFGIGSKVEFSGRGNRALDQWSIWAKGGIAF
ncbi:MAG TPA: hypothetical protein VJ201_05815 [Candidatus Babeliales bacterium]|nr:hypothetical protein [Candidatus Babeliales bacterium]